MSDSYPFEISVADVKALQDDLESSDFGTLLLDLSRENESKFLLSNTCALGLVQLGEYHLRLTPLTLKNSVKLFASHCPEVQNDQYARKVCNFVVTESEANEVPSPNIAEGTRRKFELIGDGVPSNIRKAAWNVKLGDLLKLANDLKKTPNL